MTEWRVVYKPSGHAEVLCSTEDKATADWFLKSLWLKSPGTSKPRIEYARLESRSVTEWVALKEDR